MSGKRDFKVFVGDFETTVYEGQTYTEVWASALVEMWTEDVVILNSLDATFDYIKGLNKNLIIYYHNLKFDGAFWTDYLLRKGFKLAGDQVGSSQFDITWITDKDMKNNTFKLSISDMGQWYTLKFKVSNKLIELRDSLKLLPFSVKAIGKSFATKHKKLDMEYEGYRYAGCTITEEEREYIANEVLVVKEALEIMYKQGHSKLTIGSCCLSEYKMIIGKRAYEESFPDLYNMAFKDDSFGDPNVGEYIRRSYKGGWCYLVKGKAIRHFRNGVTCDVNSLYPSMMHSMSGNVYPVGQPEFWKGEMPELPKDCYYFIRIRTRFYLKKGKLPFIQMKGTFLYRGTECLETSDVYYKGKYHRFIYDEDGNKIPTTVTLTLTCSDYKLFLEHYDVEDFEVLDGCYFRSMSGIFDEYIDKYRKIKMESKGALRTLAKLFLNNLYGKMASNTDSSFKVPYIDPVDNIVRYMGVAENNKKPGYIAVGSAITSYARCFTIRAAQANYYGVHKPGFIYADTDSIHCDLPSDKVKGITVHPTEFCCWKVESYWDDGWFVRQKTYAEHITHEDGEPVDEPYWSIKCAGMPDRCKNLLSESMKGYQYKEGDNYTEDELKFLATDRTIEDFSIGLKVPGKLYPKRVPGGIVLTEGFYEMR